MIYSKETEKLHADWMKDNTDAKSGLPMLKYPVALMPGVVVWITAMKSFTWKSTIILSKYEVDLHDTRRRHNSVTSRF